MKKKLNYKIGDWVKVYKVIERHEDEDNNITFKSKEVKPFYAQITGATRRQEGKIHYHKYNHSYISEFDGGYEPGYLDVKNTVFVWKVRRGMTNKEIEVFEKDMNYMMNYAFFKLPLRFNSEWTKEAREEMSKISKDFPRDEKGRWI